MSVFHLIDRLTLSCDNGNEDPVTLQFITEEVTKDLSGEVIPTKCNLYLSGTVTTEEDKDIAKLFNTINKFFRWYSIFPHSKKSWMKTHHDLIVEIMDIYNKYHEVYHLRLRIKSVDVKGSKDNYEKILKYFNLVKEEEPNA